MSDIGINSTPINSGNSPTASRNINIIEIRAYAPIPSTPIQIEANTNIPVNYIADCTSTPQYKIDIYNRVAPTDYVPPSPYVRVKSKDNTLLSDMQFFRLFIGGSGNIAIITPPSAAVAFGSSGEGGSGSGIAQVVMTRYINLPYIQIAYDSINMKLQDKDTSTITAVIPATHEYIDIIDERVGTNIKVELIYVNKNNVLKKVHYMRFGFKSIVYKEGDDFIEINGSIKQDYSGIPRILSYTSGTFNTESVWASETSGIVVPNPRSNAKAVNLPYLGDNTVANGKLSVTYPFIEPSIRPQNRVTFSNAKRAITVSTIEIKMDNTADGTIFVLNE